MIVEFTLSIEVDDDMELPANKEQTELFNGMLADMEEIIGRNNFALDNADWEVVL